jgi:hypothetical protein
MTDDRFIADHAPGAKWITASRWPALVLGPADRPKWMPSPYALGCHMLGTAPFDDGEKAHLRRGKLLEPVGARLAIEDHGLKLIAEQERVTREDVPALAYIDLTTENARIELKTLNERDFLEKWNGRPPLGPRVQAQAQMVITGDEWCYVGAIVLGYMEIRLELFEERRHPAMGQLLLDRAGEFLEILRRGDLPPMDESASSYAAWAETARFAEGERLRLLDPEAITRSQEWRLARKGAKLARQTDEECKAWFAARCGEAEIIELPDGTTINRKKINRDGYSVQPSSFVQWRLHRERYES